MAQKRPRHGDGSALLIDDSTEEALAAKRQHVEQNAQPMHPLDTEEGVAHAVKAKPEQRDSDCTDSNGGCDISDAMAITLPQPQRLPVPALLFRPRQLQAVASATTTPVQPKPATTTSVPELRVLSTIDWRSTDETESEARDDMDDSQQRQDEQEEDDEDEQQLRENGDDGIKDSADDMELEAVVSRMHSLVLPRRITFGRRQRMPIIRPTRPPSGGSVHEAID